MAEEEGDRPAVDVAFGQVLRELREATKLSQERRTFISDLERGRRGDPPLQPTQPTLGLLATRKTEKRLKAKSKVKSGLTARGINTANAANPATTVASMMPLPSGSDGAFSL